MSWSAQVFRYCERGADPSFWAEPINAATNGAFLIAAVVAGISFARQPRPAPAPGVAVLIDLVFIIGVGSFLFHTFATRWSAQADVIPIGLFMLAYMGYALRVYLDADWLWTLAGLALFIGTLQLAGDIDCRPGLFGTAAARGPCLNGTAGYVPAFLAMLGIGAVLRVKKHRASGYLLLAAGVFLASMLFRTVDLELCSETRLAGSLLGTHFLWHLLNAATLYLLLMAAVRHGYRVRA
ncbi:MAG: ceramidase domain-containing protein [Hyphomicrobiaceae bacterium]|nr:ceramidase domain-containing protein [Hyphomicrobiaceae bacterium]